MYQPAISSLESDFFRSFSLLDASSKQELHRYLNYLLMQQRQAEVQNKLFQDAKLLSLLDALGKEVAQPEKFSQTLRNLKHRYYDLLSAVYEKYAVFLNFTESFHLAKDFGNVTFDYVEQALLSGNSGQIAFEVQELQQAFHALSRAACE